MRKIVALNLIISLTLWTFAPASSFAQEATSTMEAPAGAVQEAGTTTQEVGTTTNEIINDIDEIAANTTTTVAIATTTGEIADGALSTATTTQKATTTSEELAGATGGAATTTQEAATTTEGITNAAAAREVSGTTETAAITTAANGGSNASSTVARQPEFSVLAIWQMTEDGMDDSLADFAQFEPSGEYQVAKKIKICGVVSQPSREATAGEAGDTMQLEGVYGQMFFPADAAFGAGDGNGRKGCGQPAVSACKMERLMGEAGFDLFCEKIQKNNTALPTFAGAIGNVGNPYEELCAADGKLLNQTASVYCCDQELAYDDIPGDYEAAVIARGANGDYGNMLSSKFAYLPLSKMDIDFNNVYYGTVKEGVEAVAADIGSPELLAKAATITNATVRNVGNTTAKISLWQDDMGLGKTDGVYNIRYGSRLSKLDASWTHYGPFETIVMPDALAPGQSVDMDFSVKVLDFPVVASGSDPINYHGQMKIDAVSVTDASYQCAASLVNEAPPTLPATSNNAQPAAATTTEQRYD
jgi:hypothetical protein